jgi:hypothetical protein
MRTPLLAFIAGLCLAPLARADQLPAFSQAPTEAFLRQLDTQQLEILRVALRSCGLVGARRVDRNPCVIMRTDEGITQAGNPDLAAFHRRLVPKDRYDETRSSVVWLNWAKPN